MSGAEDTKNSTKSFIYTAAKICFQICGSPEYSMLQSLLEILNFTELFFFSRHNAVSNTLKFVPQVPLNNIWLVLLAFVPKTKGPSKQQAHFSFHLLVQKASGE